MRNDENHSDEQGDSKKLILIAFLLCVICAHRIYAGRIVSGVVQLALMAEGICLLYEILVPVAMYAAAHPLDMVAIAPQALLYPAIVLGGTSLWVFVDAARLVTGRFRDGKGKLITRPRNSLAGRLLY